MADNEEKRFGWHFGLQNPADHFLTAEPFGNKVNSGGVSLKKKQTWLLDMDANDSVFIQNLVTKRYLAVDKYGTVECVSETGGGETEKFKIEYLNDGSGRWGFKHIKNGYFLGGDGEGLHCLAKKASEDELSAWYVIVATHPQIALKNVCRRRYVKLADNQLQCTDVNAWGPESLVTVEFRCGKYSFKSADNLYLSRDGSLTEQHDGDTKFSMELKFNAELNFVGAAFKDQDGKYLHPYGPKGILKTRNKSISKDEMFLFEELHPQVSFFASNKKYVSIRQGEMDVLASQRELTNKEIFQLEFQPDVKKWAIYTVDMTYWSCNSAGGIQANATKISDNCLFQIIWQDDGTCALRASNGKLVFNKKTGSMIAGSCDVTELETFIVMLVNRPLIVLKGENGYVGLKTSGSVKTGHWSNKAKHDVLVVETGPGSCYYIKGANGKYWTVNQDDKSVHANGASPEEAFVVELKGNSTITLKDKNNKYLKTEKSGGLICKSDVSKSAIWRI